jgi:hypothetical protein
MMVGGMGMVDNGVWNGYCGLVGWVDVRGSCGLG